jgi:glycosyltransferase involved in cell wall biosynthesis
MRLSVIFSTYKSPAWLEKTFWGFLEQSHREFEIIVADDGSGDKTRELVDQYREHFAAIGVGLRHEWQADEGFRKCRILNRAIVAASSDYLVFTDGDCICRRDFLATHAARAERGYYLSGSYFKLPMETSLAIRREDVAEQRCFDWNWLRANGLPKSAKRSKIATGPGRAKWMNRLTPTACNLKGSNASAWREDLLAVGGFDERMRWGGLDRELGVRLQNRGIRARHVRYDAICVHLNHARGYKDPEMVRANKELRLNVARTGTTRTDYGIEAEHV